MIDFTIKEDFPGCEIEFDQPFSNPNACYGYLTHQMAKGSLYVKNVVTTPIGLTPNTFTFTGNVNINFP